MLDQFKTKKNRASIPASQLEEADPASTAQAASLQTATENPRLDWFPTGPARPRPPAHLPLQNYQEGGHGFFWLVPGTNVPSPAPIAAACQDSLFGNLTPEGYPD